MKIILPWPSRVLSPNARVHWATKAKAVKKARRDGYNAALVAGYTKMTFDQHEGRLQLFIDFYCPTRRFIDADNALAMCKAALDGISDCLAVNDRRFVHHLTVREDTFIGGKVEIQILTEA